MSSESSDRTPVVQRYLGPSRVDADALNLVADRDRAPVRVSATLRRPLLVREALSVLHEVVKSDLRYVPKDRSAYLAYQRLKKRSVGLAQLQAQQAYFDWLARNDPLAWFVLDPVVSVHPDAILFEVFSKDEGTYAQLRIGREAVQAAGEWVCGSTNVDFSDALHDEIQRIRSTRAVRLNIGADAVELGTGERSVIEKRVQLPNSWLRGFLQVQSAASLSRAGIRLAPIELYNVLRQLRMHADQKRKGRAIRVELVPGEAPRLVLEPWETVLTTRAGPYAGRRPEVVRIWGRRRWGLARRLLPFVDDVELHLLGSGLPSFLVLRAGPVQLTLGLTGFTASNWSRSVQFDTLLPWPAGPPEQQQRVLSRLQQSWATDLQGLANASGIAVREVLPVLQAAGQHGLVMFDIASRKVRLRSLLAEAPNPEALAYRNDRERVAHDLADGGAVRIESEERQAGLGVGLVGEVEVKADERTYRPSFFIDDDGRVQKPSCTCHHFRSHGLKEGPCAHMLALRLAYAQVLAERDAGRGSLPMVETRTYSRRDAGGEAITQVSLQERRVRVRWGQRADEDFRVQNLVFDTPGEARVAFDGRVGALEAAGWLDATAT